MPKLLLPLLLGLALMAAAAPTRAACYADYKAKQDGPLRLHYGVIELNGAACDDKAAARAEIAGRIRSDGWRLLTVMSIFDRAGLDQRRQSAGNYFLRY